MDVLVGGSQWPRSRQGTRGDNSMADVLVVAAGRGTQLPAAESMVGNSNLVSYQLPYEPNNGVSSN